MANLEYLNYSQLKLADNSITQSINEIESTLARFNGWKSKKIPLDPRLLNDLDNSLNQLDLTVTQLQKNKSDHSFDQVAFLLSYALSPYLGSSWIYVNQENIEIQAQWKRQKQFTESIIPLLLVVAIHLLQATEEKTENEFPSIQKSNSDKQTNIKNNPSRFALISSLSCYFFKRESYPWTKSVPSEIHDTLKKQLDIEFTNYAFYFEYLLKDIIKPVFLKSASHPDISEAGRKMFKADGNLPRLSHAFSSDFSASLNENPDAWKNSQSHVIALLELFILDIGDETLRLKYNSRITIQENWSFITPCILNILDYHEPMFKKMGADLLLRLIDSTPSHYFRQTGLPKIYWDGLKPSLSFLPPSTPTEISVPLSKSTFEAMTKLSYLVIDNSKRNNDVDTIPVAKELQEQYLLEGVFTAVSFCQDNIAMMTQIFQNAKILILEHLKTYTVPHTKQLVLMVTTTLGNPFVTYSESLLTSAIEFLQALIKTVWFRIPYYRYDILFAIVRIVKRLDEDQIENKSENLKSSSTDFYEMLAVTVDMMNEALLICDTKNLDSTLSYSVHEKELIALRSKEPSFDKLMNLI